MDSAKNSRTNHNRRSQLFNSSATDSDDNLLDNSFPKIPIEMEPVQLMNQLLMQLIMKPMIEIHPAPFAGTAAENILNWLESFNGIATHNVWNDQKQLQVILVYLKDIALNFYSSLSDQTKADVDLLKNVLQDRYHTQDHLVCQTEWIRTGIFPRNIYKWPQ